MEDNESSPKLNFISKIIISIKDFEKYILLSAEKSSKALSYFIRLILLFSSIIAIAYTFKFAKIVNSISKYINDNIEEINYESGSLEIITKEAVQIENENNLLQFIIIDTGEDADLQDYTSKLNLYDTGIIILKDKTILKNRINNGQTIYEYSRFMIDNFNKSQLMEIITGRQIYYFYAVLFFTLFIYLFLFYFTQMFIDAICLALLGYLVGRINRMRIKFTATFNIGIYALTLPIILKLIYIITNMLTGIEIKYFEWMYTTISYVYVVVAILMIKADFIDKQMQMMKIYEEREIKKEENLIIDDKDEKEKQDDKEKDKEKDKKNEGKDNNLGEPQDPAMQE